MAAVWWHADESRQQIAHGPSDFAVGPSHLGILGCLEAPDAEGLVSVMDANLAQLCNVGNKDQSFHRNCFWSQIFLLFGRKFWMQPGCQCSEFR